MIFWQVFTDVTDSVLLYSRSIGVVIVFEPGGSKFTRFVSSIVYGKFGYEVSCQSNMKTLMERLDKDFRNATFL